MTWQRVLALALSVMIGISARSTHAQSPVSEEAQTVEPDRAAEARAHFTRGGELYAAGDLRGTLTEFERAYELRPSPLLCLHIGRVALELRQFARSYVAFAQFLATETPGDPMHAEKRTEAEAMVRDLAPRIAHLRLETNVPGARLSIDEELIGEAPLAEPIVLDTGTYRVRASKPGFAALTREISLAGGDNSTVRLDLEAFEPLPPPAVVERPVLVPAPVAEKRAAPPATLMTRGLWAGFGVAAALAVAGGVTGIYALKTAADLDRERFRGPSAKQDFADDSDRVRALALTSDVLFGAALVSAQVTLVLVLVRARHPSRSGMRVSGALQPRGVVIEGAF